MSFFKRKKSATEIISAPVHVLLNSLKNNPEQWEIEYDRATHLGNPVFSIIWDAYEGGNGPNRRLRICPPIALKHKENEELKRELLFATYTEAAKKYAKLFPEGCNSDCKPITKYLPIDTAPADKLIIVTGHFLGNPACERYYSLVRNFTDVRTGDKLNTEYLTHWAPVDEVPE